MARLPRAPSRTWLSKTLLFLLLVTLATGVPRVKNSLGASLTIVDVHAHFLPDRDLTFDDAVASAIKHMDQYGVARTIMMSPPRGRKIPRNYDYPDFRTALKKYPGRFVFLAGGGTLNPLLHRHADPASVTDAVKMEFAAIAHNALDEGAIGFGEMSSLHISLSRAHGYTYVPADHPLLLLLADIAAERDVPLDLHMDALVKDTKPPAKLAAYPNNPDVFPATLTALQRLLAHNPKAKIIWDHAGSDRLGDLTPQVIRRLMDRFPNLYVSLKVVGKKSPAHNKLLSGRAVVAAWLALLKRHSDRFMLGTDNFYASANAYPSARAAASSNIGHFSRANRPKLMLTTRFLSLLPADLARKISSENAIRLFRLGKVEPVSPQEPPAIRQGGKRCKQGNMAACRRACARGKRKACARLKR
jgi:predicted TIM-barrel fold metal-dependent hydrolase